ncbi:unnamed protein product [Mytilus coruscus]|uniref:Uncharacterized protein n=1 Tax=Mytilus coruscus TaxID=42192 RepID=A0A6J8BSH6_MYTCO|nr:unnamed protein product [Mytilus coruscus]
MTMMSTGLTCLSCNSVADINDCLQTLATCQNSNEECYLDKTILPSLQAVFSAGCRSKKVCDLFAAATGKREVSRSKRTNVACAQCCTTSSNNSTEIPCNGYLCNQKPKPVGHTCGVCERIEDPTTCSIIKDCPPNEVCDVTLKGYKKSNPGKYIGPNRKRVDGEIVICSSCCDTRTCNMANCKSLINTALKVARYKSTKQSANFYKDASLSHLAVDGDYTQWMANSFEFCTHTYIADQPTWWAVILAQNYDINNIVIYGRTDCCSTYFQRKFLRCFDIRSHDGHNFTASNVDNGIGFSLCGLMLLSDKDKIKA